MVYDDEYKWRSKISLDSPFKDDLFLRQQRQRNCLVRRNSIPEREIDEEDTETAELQVNLRKLTGHSRPSSLIEAADKDRRPADKSNSLQCGDVTAKDNFTIVEAVGEEEEDESGGQFKVEEEDEEVSEAFSGWTVAGEEEERGFPTASSGEGFTPASLRKGSSQGFFKE